jgi:hypothetical protein
MLKSQKKRYVQWRYKKEGNFAFLFEKYHEKPWDYDLLSGNPNITLRDVLNHPEKPWNWYFISKNPSITFRDVLNYPKKPWDWNNLSSNPNITFRDILNHPEKSWDWSGVSANPNITFRDILNHPKKPWDWWAISYNKFFYDETVFKREIKKDIKKRRDNFKSLKLYGDLSFIIEKYIGYR